MSSAGDGTFSLRWRWIQELAIEISMFLALKLNSHVGGVVVSIYVQVLEKRIPINGGQSLSELGLKTGGINGSTCDINGPTPLIRAVLMALLH